MSDGSADPAPPVPERDPPRPPGRAANRPSRRNVLLVLGVVCLAVFVAGMAAAWNNRHHTLCRDGRPPTAQRPGLLGQTIYRCHDGQTVTTS